jgi:TolA-binding protein
LFYRAVELILRKEKGQRAEQLLREYLRKAPLRTAYPSPSVAHQWLGQQLADQSEPDAAAREYETALKLDPKNKTAAEALKHLRK